MQKYVVLLRVSTQRQGDSQLGLLAQQRAIEDYIARNPGIVLATYEEVESGRKKDRPMLKEAVFQCKLTGATLLIANLSRLTRSVMVTATLLESGVPFVACNMPSANNFTIHILAAVAEDEAKAISQRTKAALLSAKLRGTKLGVKAWQNLSKHPEAAAVGRQLGGESRKRKADEFASKLYPVITHHSQQGLDLPSIAERLNEAHILTARGKVGAWTPLSVSNILKRGRNLIEKRA